MANPQKENGYTPIANELLEWIYRLKINATQFRIIMVIMRYTYGFSRKEHELSLSFIANALGADRSYVSKQLTELVECKIIEVVANPNGYHSRVLKLNKNYFEWNKEVLYKNTTPCCTDIQPPVVQNYNSTVEQSYNPTVVQSYNQDKQNIKQNIKQIYNAHFSIFWNAYPKKVGKANAEKIFKKLNIDVYLLNTILKAIENQKKQWKDPQYIPHPSTWLNQRRWEDELTPSNTTPQVSPDRCTLSGYRRLT